MSGWRTRTTAFLRRLLFRRSTNNAICREHDYLGTYKYEPLPPVEGPRDEWDRQPSRQLSTRLLTIHGGQHEDDIEVDLEVVDLNDQLADELTYDALSYVWGSPELSNTIYVGKEKETVKITANLDEAIRYMRYPDRPRTMWIDGLCIDQHNIEERSRQVAYMCHIFWGATRVVVWLGKAADDSDRAMDTLKHVASRTASGGKSGAAEGMTELDERRSGGLASALALDGVERLSILALLQRPWFERIWVRQEVANAGEESLVACGTKTLSWMAARRALNCLHSPPALTLLGPQHSQEYQNRFAAAEHLVGFGTFFLKDLCMDLRGTKCTDPRDRVYGLLGILDNGDYLKAIVPDYSKSVSEVYISVVLEYIATTKSVDFLLSCHKDSREEISVSTADALPTWVPDWAHPDSDTYRAYRCLLTEIKLCPFQSFAKYLGRGVLRVAGVSYGTIVEVLDLDDSTSEALSTSIRTLSPPNAADTHYPGGGNLLNAFGITLCANKFADNTYPPYSIFFERDSFRYGESQNAMKKIMDGEDLSGRSELLLTLVESNNHNARFFITDKGFLGWTPTTITEGDQVTSILGCQAPMILRPSTMNKGQFEVIGPSYTHGASHGSAFLGPLPSNLRPIWHRKREDGLYGMRFHDVETGAIHSEDPRLENLPVDLTEYRERRQKGEGEVLLPISPETWRAHGVDVVNFDLI